MVSCKPAVVGNVLRCGYCRSVRADVVHDVRPVDAYGYQRVVHLKNIIARIAKMPSWILLLKPSVGQHAVVDERQRRIVHAPQSFAEHDEAVRVGFRLRRSGVVGWFQ